MAFSLGNLGVALALDKDWQEAKKCLEESLATYKQAGQNDCPECRGFAANLAACEKALEDKK